MVAVARIQVDFGMLEGETLSDWLTKIGDILMPMLDGHEEDEPCIRFVSIEAWEFDSEDYTISFTPDEEAELGIGVPDIFREAYPNN